MPASDSDAWAGTHGPGRAVRDRDGWSAMFRSVRTCRASTEIRSASVMAAKRRQCRSGPGLDERPKQRAYSTCDEARWPDVTAVCGECKALVDRIDTEYGGGCEGFCAAVGLRCAAVWEERKDTCEAKRGVGCGVSLGGTHDAICSCL